MVTGGESPTARSAAAWIAIPLLSSAAPTGPQPTSGEEPLEQPSALGPARVAEAIVQPECPPLPELDGVGFKTEPAPERRQRDVLALVARGEPVEPGLELPAGIEHL